MIILTTTVKTSQVSIRRFGPLPPVFPHEEPPNAPLDHEIQALDFRPAHTPQPRGGSRILQRGGGIGNRGGGGGNVTFTHVTLVGGGGVGGGGEVSVGGVVGGGVVGGGEVGG